MILRLGICSSFKPSKSVADGWSQRKFLSLAYGRVALIFKYQGGVEMVGALSLKNLFSDLKLLMRVSIEQQISLVMLTILLTI